MCHFIQIYFEARITLCLSLYEKNLIIHPGGCLVSKKKKKREKEREKIANVGEGVGVIGTLGTVDGNVKWCSYCRKCYGHFQKRKHRITIVAAVVLSVCHVLLFTTTQTVAHQAPLFVEFSRQEYWRR